MMNSISAGYLENHHMSDHELILDLYKKIEALEQRISQLENNQVTESDIECYAEGLGLLEEGEEYDY